MLSRCASCSPCLINAINWGRWLLLLSEAQWLGLKLSQKLIFVLTSFLSFIFTPVQWLLSSVTGAAGGNNAIRWRHLKRYPLAVCILQLIGTHEDTEETLDRLSSATSSDFVVFFILLLLFAALFSVYATAALAVPCQVLSLPRPKSVVLRTTCRASSHGESIKTSLLFALRIWDLWRIAWWCLLLRHSQPVSSPLCKVAIFTSGPHYPWSWPFLLLARLTRALAALSFPPP